MKLVNRITICTIILGFFTFIIAIILIEKSNSNNLHADGTNDVTLTNENIYCEIKFPVEVQPTITHNTVIRYDVDLLNSKLNGMGETYVYYDPEITDYSIVSELGFNISDYSILPEEPNIRWYSEQGRKLEIDKYGRFVYTTNAEDTWFDFPFDNNGTIQIAEKFLKDYGLLNHTFSNYSIDNTTNMTAEETKIVARTVNFYHKLDGKGVGGNQRVSVDINGYGEVTSVNYSIRNYKKQVNAKLISVEDAINNILSGKSYNDIPTVSKELVLEDVVVTYWTQNLNYNNTCLQPVYTFIGKSLSASTQEWEEFSITVQANRGNVVES